MVRLRIRTRRPWMPGDGLDLGYSGGIELIHYIQRIEHTDQVNLQVGYKLDPGEAGTMWYTVLTAETISRSQIEIESAFSDSDKSVH